ncbi:cytochrome P450 [Streptomyces sp. Amel2xC10]|uniref:cytochrome P450 n=1 Tax=Streptomyces sp. Amel2xC10 TaxID=1305826 RepID=UPI000A08A5B1|nr:cytochrome P450 [Streptomyces sp. Amel2xC10]SMF44607.1 Cytochrome P450 [Streptomyces sp. Amel2xC10]
MSGRAARTSTDRRPRPLPVDRPTPVDPPTEFRRLRTDLPVAPLAFPDGPPGWLVTRYDDVRTALADPRLSSRRPHLNSHVRASLITPEEMAALRPSDLLTSDPPEHTRLRRLVNGQFTTRRVNRLTARIQEIVDQHLDALAAARRPADLMTTVALPVPSLVISELLGVPFTDRDRYQRLTAELLSLDRTREQLLASKAEMKDYLLHLIRAKRTHPGDDLLSGLLQAQSTDTTLTDDEISALAQLVLIAGHETTANVIGLAVLLLLRPPRLWDTVRHRPDLVDGVIEETLRYATVLQFGLLRVAREPLTLAGRRIEAGERVVLHLPAANRDPARFSDPDRFDPQRPDAAKHLSFGHGPHHCIGDRLARIELRTVLTTMLHRFPDLRLAADPDQIPTHRQRVVHGPARLPVDLTP